MAEYSVKLIIRAEGDFSVPQWVDDLEVEATLVEHHELTAGEALDVQMSLYETQGYTLQFTGDYADDCPTCQGLKRGMIREHCTSDHTCEKNPKNSQKTP